jgi:hypothetical protein
MKMQITVLPIINMNNQFKIVVNKIDLLNIMNI